MTKIRFSGRRQPIENSLLTAPHRDRVIFGWSTNFLVADTFWKNENSKIQLES